MNKYYYILLSLLLFTGCNQNSSQTEKEYIKNLEEKNKALEKELQETKDNSNPNNTSQKSKQETNKSKDYFTIGSTEDEVIKFMGDPTSYVDLGSLGKQFRYGASVVFFEHGKVKSYNNVEENLRVKVK